MVNFITRIFFIFMFYSVCGWIVETIRVSLKEKRFVNRGFLFGPYCPIYGFGAISLYILLGSLIKRPIIFFFLSIIIAGILEYLTNYIQEKKYHARWWDYSDRPFNLNGRICLENLLQFGIAGTIVFCFINPYILDYFLALNKILKIVILSVFYVVILTDNIVSKLLIKEIKRDIDDVKKDNTYEITKELEKLLKQKNIFKRRLFKAYPGFKQSALKNALKQGEENLEKRIKDLEEKVKYLEEKIKSSKWQEKSDSRKILESLFC